MKRQSYISALLKGFRFTPHGRHRVIGAIILTFFILFCVILPFFALLQKKAAPYASALAESSAGAIISAAISDELRYVISMPEYASLIKASYKSDGSISHISLDSTLSSSLVSTICERLNRRLSYRSVSIRIPIGTLLFKKSFSGRGVPVSVKGSMSAFSSAKISTSISSAGVNQTLHSVILSLSVNAKLLFFDSTLPISVEQSTVIAETLVVGSTPDGFFG